MSAEALLEDKDIMPDRHASCRAVSFTPLLWTSIETRIRFRLQHDHLLHQGTAVVG
jgi:hypothetical protein